MTERNRNVLRYNSKQLADRSPRQTLRYLQPQKICRHPENASTRRQEDIREESKWVPRISFEYNSRDTWTFQQVPITDHFDLDSSGVR